MVPTGAAFTAEDVSSKVAGRVGRIAGGSDRSQMCWPLKHHGRAKGNRRETCFALERPGARADIVAPIRKLPMARLWIARIAVQAVRYVHLPLAEGPIHLVGEGLDEVRRCRSRCGRNEDLGRHAWNEFETMQVG